MILSSAGIEAEIASNMYNEGDDDMILHHSWEGRIAVAIVVCLALSACISRLRDSDVMEEWDFLKDEEERKSESIAGSLSCMVESIRCLPPCKQCSASGICDDGGSRSSDLDEPLLNFEAQCVISNKTPYKIDMAYWYIYAGFCERILYANGKNGEAVRMRTWDMIMPNPKGWKYFTVEAMGSRKIKVVFSASDHSCLRDRLPETKWQMLDEPDGKIPVWVWSGEAEPDHSHYDTESFSFEKTFPKVLPLEEMGASPREWRDPKTGIAWTYTVFRNEVSLGSGYSDVCAVPERTAGELSIPAEIEGLPVVRIGPFAFCCCDRLCVVNVPHSVRSIGHSAFSDCDKLKTMNISSNLMDIAENAFVGCPDLVLRRY